MLSNTQAPYYYRCFRDSVLRGEIPVNKEISQEMNRIDELISNPNYYYDSCAVEGWISFCENELTLTDGSDLFLLDSFKLWGEQIFCWYYFEERKIFKRNSHAPGGYYVKKMIKKRLIRKQLLIVARGAAKTIYCSTIHNYFLNVDTSTTQQITVAPTLRQADEVLSPIRTSIARSRGPLFKFLTEGSLQNTTGSKAKRVKLSSTKKGIENFITGSILEPKPMSIDKLQGLHCKIATIDEWLSGVIREDVIGCIEQSASKNNNDDYIIIATSSEGTVRNGPGDTVKMELKKILNGEYYNPHISIWYYKLDSIDEVNTPEMWIKANPNIGLTVSYEAYQLDVERMIQNPSTRNDILAKRFGIEVEGFTFFFSYDETKCHQLRNYNGYPCSLGIDLSQGDDFCAFTFLFPRSDGSFGIKTINYITENKRNKVHPAMRVKYDEFIKEGTLVVMPGIILDLDQVYDDLDKIIMENQYDVRCLGYDPYHADKFIARWSLENSSFGVVKVPQGSRTESVPLGEIKNLSENGMLLFDQALMGWSIGNCIVLEDNNGNRKLYKRRHEEKIDPVAAMLDAYVAFKDNTDMFL